MSSKVYFASFIQKHFNWLHLLSLLQLQHTDDYSGVLCACQILESRGIQFFGFMDGLIVFSGRPLLLGASVSCTLDARKIELINSYFLKVDWRCNFSTFPLLLLEMSSDYCETKWDNNSKRRSQRLSRLLHRCSWVLDWGIGPDWIPMAIVIRLYT